MVSYYLNDYYTITNGVLKLRFHVKLFILHYRTVSTSYLKPFVSQSFLLQ